MGMSSALSVSLISLSAAQGMFFKKLGVYGMI
jgi:hypothetical protein